MAANSAEWAAFNAAMGNDRFCIEYNGARGVADEVARALIESAAAARGNTGSAVAGRLGQLGLTADQSEDT